jgi:hypothetical protein
MLLASTGALCAGGCAAVSLCVTAEAMAFVSATSVLSPEGLRTPLLAHDCASGYAASRR